ncbi:Metallo-beta-lactamase family protein [Roseibacterium elongatum DSM 19469]|uniref:Metallo-beta-lactamase family protein n=1 Tax=Roseicyclus elongatus DSM 19469 TaxID=1294273 RepID=W8RPY9_9RHOB|nr:MBL fold metallo-hydrolase [Roseibacterium elongatum]AHM03108.1 Metallo-beta-lactamase family protein [Roseibacterium elongatum DSM 19469]
MIRYPQETPPDPGDAVELADGVLWLRIPLPMALDHVNVFAFREDDGWAVVDTGLNTRRTREGWDAALSGPLKGQPVTRVLVTHHHPDHVGLAGWFQERGAELLTTRTAWLFARMLTLDEQERATPEQIAFWQGAGMDAEILHQRRTERPFNFADVVHPMPLGFTQLRDGATIRLGGRDWIIRFGQGHAPDHATLWSTDGRLVIGGDQLLPSISPNLGVYATEPEADPVGDWMAACTALAPHATEDQLVLPGHKLPFFGLPDRMRQLIENHHGALERLRAHLADGPRTAGECFAPLFKRKIDSGTYGLALVEAVGHLNHLHALGEVRRTRRDDGAWLWYITS